MQLNGTHEKMTSDMYSTKNNKSDINVNSVVSYFFPPLVPINSDKHVIRHAFDITERSVQKKGPIQEPVFKLDGKQIKNIDISSPQKRDSITEYAHSSTHLQSKNFIPKTMPESVSNKKENVDSFKKISIEPEEVYTSSTTDEEALQITLYSEPVLSPTKELEVLSPLENVNSGVQDISDPTMSDAIKFKSSAVVSSSIEEPSSSPNFLPIVEYSASEKQNSSPSFGGLSSIEPSYTHVRDLGIATLQPTPPLPYRSKSSPTNLAQLRDDKLDATSANESKIEPSPGAARSILNSVLTAGLQPKSAVADLLDLEVNRFEEKERAHPALSSLSPVFPPEYNRVSLLNRLKEISYSRKLISSLAANNVTLSSPDRNDNIKDYISGKLGGPHEAVAWMPPSCSCASPTSYKTLVVMDDEVIGTYGRTGFRRRNFDFGTAWRNFPTTTIAWPASVKEFISSAAASSCGRLTSVSTETYYHTPVRPHDVIVTHTRTRTLFTVVTRTVTRFRRV
jgi:hypothetical protein